MKSASLREHTPHARGGSLLTLTSGAHQISAAKCAPTAFTATCSVALCPLSETGEPPCENAMKRRAWNVWVMVVTWLCSNVLHCTVSVGCHSSLLIRARFTPRPALPRIPRPPPPITPLKKRTRNIPTDPMKMPYNILDPASPD